MKNRKSFRCEFLDLHTPTTHVSGITVLESTCKRCGRRILQDSQGNWFPYSYATPTQKEAEKMSDVRLIDANALEKMAIPCEIHNGASTELCVPLYQIRVAPTLPNPCGNPCNFTILTGRWINDKCSVCGKGIEDLISSPEWYKDETPNYCPFCGVKIEEAENERT